MEAPPPQPPLSTSTTPKAPDSVNSSPVSRQTGSWDGDPPLSSKLRLMCSYGGHIVPRPHDKTLCYIGGDTRMIAIDRNSISISDFHHRISKTFQNQPFILKYQLPNEDLDSLISVATDEDLENMVDEYDRLNGNGSRGRGRLRIFLFPADCSGNMEQLLVETSSTKSEDWFLNALNGKMNSADRGFSESSSVNNLLGLDDGNVGKVAVGNDVESLKKGGNGVNHDVHSMPGSPMLDTTSSFGSTSSSPSLVSANLPPIRVHVEENSKVGVEEQFQPMVVNNADQPVKQKQEETAGGFVAPPIGTVVPGVPLTVGGDYAARIYSDDERSDHGGYRMVSQVLPQIQFQQQQVPQFQQKQSGVTDLPSPDPASSEGSLTNPLSRQRQVVYQEPIAQLQPRVITNQVDLKTGDTISGSKVQMQPAVHESGYVLSGQYDQTHPQFRQTQQYIHGGTQYIPAGSIPMTPYYHVYPSQQQQHPHPQMHDQQYPVYLVPTRQTPAYNLPVHSPTYGEMTPNASSTRPQTPHHAVYNQGRAATPIVQFPSSHHQTQYAPYPSQSMASTLASNSTYEYADHAHAQQIYYNQPQMAAQYQTLTSGPVMVPVDASAQVAAEKVRTTQA